MTITEVGPGQYRVDGKTVHWVDLNASEEAGMCDCEDALWRGRECKHIRRCRDYIKMMQSVHE